MHPTQAKRARNILEKLIKHGIVNYVFQTYTGWSITKARSCLTLNIPIPDKVKKLRKMFIFTLLCGVSKGFMKALKAFIKPFEAPQRSVKIKI